MSDEKVSDVPRCTDEKKVNAAKACALLQNKKNILVVIGATSLDQHMTLEKFTQNPAEIIECLVRKMDKPRAPDATHRLLSKLADTGKLLRCYTSDIDAVELQAGVPSELIAYTRGNCLECKCMSCGISQSSKRVQKEWCKHVVSKCGACKGVVRPNILFWGESIPETYQVKLRSDLAKCDCLLVLGCSLQMNTTNDILLSVPNDIPRIMISEAEVDLKPVQTAQIAKLQDILKRLEEECVKVKRGIDLLNEDTTHRDVNVLEGPCGFARNSIDFLDEGK